MAIATERIPSTSAASSVPPSFLWANLPSAALFPGSVVRVTDVGGGPTLAGGGNFFMSNGVRWKPMNGNIVLDTIDTANSGIANTTEQQLNPNAVIVPGGVIAFTDRLRLTIGISKSGTTDICTFRLRLGPLKSILDPSILTITIPAASASFNDQIIFKRKSATSIQRQGNGDSATSFGGSALAYPTDITGLSSLDTIGQYFSLTQQMTTGTEFITIQDYILEDLPTDSA